MSDVDAIREALTVLHRRLQEEGYGPEFGQPDPEDLFNAALAALDRMEEHDAKGLTYATRYGQLQAENTRLREASKKRAVEYLELTVENARLREGSLRWKEQSDWFEDKAEQLTRRVERLRKAVNWLRGALHDDAEPHSGHRGEVHDCNAWDCIHAREVLEEIGELPERGSMSDQDYSTLLQEALKLRDKNARLREQLEATNKAYKDPKNIFGHISGEEA